MDDDARTESVDRRAADADASTDEGPDATGSDPDSGFFLAPPETALAGRLAARRRTRIASLAVGNVLALAAWSYLSTATDGDGGGTAVSIALGVWVLTIPFLVLFGYLDLRTARREGGWTPGPARWLLGIAVPTVGPSVALAYVLRRRQAAVHDGEWGRWWLVAGLGVAVTTLATAVLVATADPERAGNAPTANVAVAVLLGSALLAPLATYYDASELRQSGDPGVLAHRLAWSIGTAAWGANLVVFAAYLLLRRRALSRERTPNQ